MKQFSRIFEGGGITTRVLRAVLFVLSIVLCTQAWAQNRIQGTVVDEEGNPVVAATVVEVDNTRNGTTTDLNGKFTLSVKPGASLDVSFLGMMTQRVPVNGAVSDLRVVLKSDMAKIDEVVVVGYGTQKRASITAAVSQIAGEELEKAPTSNITNMLAGRVSGVTAIQQSGQPGADGSSLMVRGQSVLYIVDGVPREIGQINPDDIESISVLKDASAAAVYGLDGNTVIIVTTKRGRNEKSTITYKGSYGVSQNANMLELLDGPGYAYWYNRALELDDKTPLFTGDIVQKMLNNEDGWGNTNWYKKTFGLGQNMSHSLSVTGGNDRVTYYTSLGMFDQKGNVDNFTFRRYSLRSNISAKVARSLTVDVGVSGRIQQQRQPTYSANPSDWNNLPQQAMRAHPYLPETIEINNETYSTATKTNSAKVNPIAAYSQSGNLKQRTTYIEPNISLTWDVPWVEGLKAKFYASYDMAFTHTKALTTPYDLAMGEIVTDAKGYATALSYSVSDEYSGVGKLITLQESSSYTTYGITQTSIAYDRTFDKHHVAGLVLFETRDRRSNNHYGRVYGLIFDNLPEMDFGDASIDKRAEGGTSNQSRQIGLVYRLNYDFDNRIYVEVSGRYDGSYKFAGMNGKRWGYFPSASVGWRISEEKWFSAPWVDNLKLRGGIGLTGTSAVSAYAFLNTLTISKNNTTVFGGTGQKSVYSTLVANPDLTWEKNLNYNAGVDASFWGGKLGAEFDVFYTYKYDMLAAVKGQYPSSMGGYFPTYQNINKQDIKGFDFTISHRNHVGDFNYGIKFMGSYAKRRWLYYADDPINAPDYQKLTGKEVGSVIGFLDAGLFQSEEELLNSPVLIGEKVRVGDIKYVDRNGDGKISYDQDRGYVGTSVYPKFTAGLSFDMEWKGLDLNFLLQGATGSTIALTGVYPTSWVMDHTSMTRPFYHGGNAPRYLVENSWTPENTDAFFPRLSLDVGANNSYASTRWYRPGDYLRLKTAQIGYTLPQRLTRKAGIERLRIYLEGSNLLTFSHVGKYNIDPEIPSVNNGYYPQQRVMSVGLNITL